MVSCGATGLKTLDTVDSSNESAIRPGQPTRHQGASEDNAFWPHFPVAVPEPDFGGKVRCRESKISFFRDGRTGTAKLIPLTTTSIGTLFGNYSLQFCGGDKLTVQVTFQYPLWVE